MREIKSRSKARHAAGIGDMINAYRDLVRNKEGRKPFRR
jgi:hypothetical protein